ncbi:MAG: GDP-mannose 4,6-dehydratase [Promethearchaeota archaeon]
MEKKYNILVTGGAGFIGSVLVDTLVDAGHDVIVIDNLQSGFLENLDESMDNIEFVRGDISDLELIKRHCHDVDVVFNLAANANVPYSVDHFRYDLQTNAMGTITLVEYFLKESRRDLDYFIQASSAAVYGEPVQVPIDECHPLNPVSPYGISKLTAERYLDYFCREYGFPVIIFRIFNTYGIRQPRYVILDLLKKLYVDNTKLEVLGTGEQVRDYCYVRDTVRALILGMQDSAIGEKINIAGGNPIRIRDLVELILELKGLSGAVDINYTGESWKGDIKVLIANVDKIKRLLGFKPEYDLKTGLGEMMEWFDKLPDSRKVFKGVNA